jgi:hypothetical protein
MSSPKFPAPKKSWPTKTEVIGAVLRAAAHQPPGGLAAAPLEGLTVQFSTVEALHVRRAVLGAALRDEPSPHVYVENVFSAAAYAAMCRMWPTDSPALRRWDNPGDPTVRFGNYGRRQEIIIPFEAERLPPEQRAFWLSVGSVLNGPDFARTLIERFEPYARERFGDRIDDPAFVRDELRGSLLINQHDAGYYLGPHTDRNEKVFTCLFYFPENEGLDHLGTTLYRPLEPGFSCSGFAHHDPARFERRETMPYHANSAFIFARTDVMFHGVHALTAEQLGGSRRRSIQMQFWVHNERPRASCKVMLRASVPGAMRPGAEYAVPFELANRAAPQLDAAHPFPTNLGYRWLDAAGRAAEPENAVRTPLPGPLPAGETSEGTVRVVAPAAPGRYVLLLSLIQEGVAWFDDIDPDNGVAERVYVNDEMRCEPSDDTVAAAADVFPAWAVPSSGFYPLERHSHDRFRWVGGDAKVKLHRSGDHTLVFDAESGPGMRSQPFLLRVLANGRTEIAAVEVGSRMTVALPIANDCTMLVFLAEGGDHHGAAGDPRTLNYRVFASRT